MTTFRSDRKPTGRPRNPKRAAVLRDCGALTPGREWFASGKVAVELDDNNYAVRSPLRTDYRYTLAEIAERHGVTEAQVSKWARAEGVTRHHTKGE